MTPTSLILVDKIEEVRKQNNNHWMALARLAIKHSPPQEIKNLLKRIEEADREINGLWKCLHDSLPD